MSKTEVPFGVYKQTPMLLSILDKTKKFKRSGRNKEIFNTLNNLLIKFLTFIVGVLATLDLCIHACHATQYARLDEAYAHPTLHEEQDSPQKRETKLDHALSELSRIQEFTILIVLFWLIMAQ